MEHGLRLPQSVSQVSRSSHLASAHLCLLGLCHHFHLLTGRSYTVLLSIIFGGLAIVALISVIYMLLHRRRKRNM